ncbi:MAG: SulP family inorganic anion transporter [Caldilineales bacterium]|nr:SulP family inorganic anion transporter [Caldilineales bacterium]MDW8317144.1 SulP family inorganic anion transporter [Anaerolineae bacterium]
MRSGIGTTVAALRPERSHLKSDLIAGLTFAIVNVPQAMGHAVLAAVNPVLGIYTLMVALPVGALFTGSVFMNVSTTAALSVAAGSALAIVPEDQRTQALATLVLLVGAIQLLAGLLRLGFLVRFVSNAVMTGFLNGVAVLIILGQLGDLTGYQSPFRSSVARGLDLLLHLHRVDPPTTAIGLVTLGLIALLLRTRWNRFAFIIAIGASTLALALLSLPSLGGQQSWQAVQTVGDVANIPRNLPELAMPAPRWLPFMVLPALSVAIIGLIQGAGVSQGYPNPNGKFPNISRDFFGQGMANIVASLVSGLPAGGSISGTALIMSAGARSRWTNISAGLFVAAIVLVAAPLAELVPMPALAALLIVAGLQGLRLEAAQTIWFTGRVPGVVMIITFLATLFLPLQYAVLLGVALSVVLYVVQQSNKVVVTWIVPVEGGFPLERPAPKELPSGQFTMLQIYGSLFFAAAKSLEEMLPSVDNTTRAVVALGLRGRTEIGSTFIAVLQRYVEALRARDSKLMLVGVDQRVLDQLTRTGLLQRIGEENIFMATPQVGEAMNRAAAAAHAWLRQPPAGADRPAD